MVPHGKPPNRWPRSHSPATQKNGARTSAQLTDRRADTRETAQATAPSQSAQYPARSIVGRNTRGPGMLLYTRNVKLSQRSRTRKKTPPYSSPHQNAVRGVDSTATTSSGASTTHGVSAQSVRGNASASRNADAASTAA